MKTRAAVLRHSSSTTVSAGLPHTDTRLPVNPAQLVRQERRLLHSYLGGHVPKPDIPEYIGLYRAGRLSVDKLLTHRLQRGEINAGFERLANGDAIRQIVML